MIAQWIMSQNMNFLLWARVDTHTQIHASKFNPESLLYQFLYTHTHTQWILKKLLERFTSLRAFPGGLAHLLQLKLKRSGDGRESKTTFPKRKGKQRRKIKQFVLVFDPLKYIYIYNWQCQESCNDSHFIYLIVAFVIPLQHLTVTDTISFHFIIYAASRLNTSWDHSYHV